MDDIKTVDGSSLQHRDPLIDKQRADVAAMRSAMLATQFDPLSTSQAIQNVTVLRVYHQVSRIIRYLDMMDKIEEKLYTAIEIQIDNMDMMDPGTLGALLTIQERLQNILIESHKLLKPYIEIDNLLPTTLFTQEDERNGHDASVLSKSSRDHLRLSAQQVLNALNESGDEDVG